MADKGPSLILKEIPSIPVRVEFAIPAKNPILQGFLIANCNVMSKPDMKAMAEDDDMKDDEMFDQIVVSVEGIGTSQGTLLEGQAALDEVKKGKLSQYLLPAIVGAYFEQFGEARRKNSKPSRGR